MEASERSRGETGRWSRAWPLALVLAACLPSLGTLAAPWIAEDAAILARVRGLDWLRDWTRSQYGLELVRFWRPVVSATWWLQEAWTGIDPLPLRLFNLGLHVLAALLSGAIVRRLGGGTAGALLAGGFAAFFPEQGGTVTWLAGRTDLLAGVCMLASLWAALGRAPLAGALLAFAACASKEFGFLLPLWVCAMTLAQEGALRRSIARTAPSLLGVMAAFLWRCWALGTIAGGYPAPAVSFAEGLPLGARAVLMSAWPGLSSTLLLFLMGRACGSADVRAVTGALACAAAGCVPLWPLLADGFLEPQNARLLFVAELGLALAVGCSFAREPARHGTRYVAFALALLALGWRGTLAWLDTHEWARAARAGEDQVARARLVVASASASRSPVCLSSFPASLGGAYCLGFGVADRFRSPFPAAPRPIWPLRPMFGLDSSLRPPAVPLRADGSLWPLDDEPGVPRLSVSIEGRAEPRSLTLDERAFLTDVDRSERLALEAAVPEGRLELVVYTEAGYEPVRLGTIDGQGRAEISLMQVLAAGSGVASVAQVLLQAADLGARNAYLEFRSLGPGGECRAASAWIELVWSDALLARALSER